MPAGLLAHASPAFIAMRIIGKSAERRAGGTASLGDGNKGDQGIVIQQSGQVHSSSMHREKVPVESGKRETALDVHQVVPLLGIGLASFKKRLRLLELYRTIQFGSSGFGVISAHQRRRARFHGRGSLDRLEADLDRSFPRWRDFPPKLKLGRRFYWQASLLRAYLHRLHGVVPLP